jgi:hypothetical protein
MPPVFFGTASVPSASVSDSGCRATCLDDLDPPIFPIVLFFRGELGADSPTSSPELVVIWSFLSSTTSGFGGRNAGILASRSSSSVSSSASAIFTPEVLVFSAGGLLGDEAVLLLPPSLPIPFFDVGGFRGDGTSSASVSSSPSAVLVPCAGALLCDEAVFSFSPSLPIPFFVGGFRGGGMSSSSVSSSASAVLVSCAGVLLCDEAVLLLSPSLPIPFFAGGFRGDGTSVSSSGFLEICARAALLCSGVCLIFRKLLGRTSQPTGS